MALRRALTFMRIYVTFVKDKSLYPTVTEILVLGFVARRRSVISGRDAVKKRAKLTSLCSEKDKSKVFTIRRSSKSKGERERDRACR